MLPCCYCWNIVLYQKVGGQLGRHQLHVTVLVSLTVGYSQAYGSKIHSIKRTRIRDEKCSFRQNVQVSVQLYNYDQNAAACFVSDARLSDHITPVLARLL